jgi:hypothetical protein
MTVAFKVLKRNPFAPAPYRPGSRYIFILLAGTTCALSPSAAWAQVNLTTLPDSLKTITPAPAPAQLAITSLDGIKDPEDNNKCVSKNSPRANAIRAKMQKDALNNKWSKLAKILQDIVVQDLKKPNSSHEFVHDDVELSKKNPNLFIEKHPDFLQNHPEFSAQFTPIPPNLSCRIIGQPINVSLTLPLNPTWESNVLKNPSNNSPGFSAGFGGSATITTGGLEGRPFDLAIYNVSSASARYPNFFSKSLDAITEQAAYQVFLGGSYYGTGGKYNAIGSTGDNLPKTPPAANVVTYDTLSVGFQNQTAFLPGLRPETADLFTPQVTLARSNISLFGAALNNICHSETPKVQPGAPKPDPGATSEFCYYLDLSLTAGQTVSDAPTQQNTNFTGSVTPGWRIDCTDWKVTLPTAVTSRFYNDVVGGRRDVLFQMGPALSYSKPPTAGEPYITFSIAATYNQNFSTLAIASWRGVIIQPTLTIAFIPLLPPK